MASFSLARAAWKIGSWTMLSRIIGYGRDMLMAQVMGASATAEAFQMAFTFPNLFRNLFGEGAMNAALIPHFNDLSAREGAIIARQFLGDVLLMVGMLMLLISGAAYLFMPEIISVFAWGFIDPDKVHLTTSLARICLPYLFCIIIAAIFGGMLNRVGKFSIPAAAPMLLNFFMIAPLAVAVFWESDFSVFTLAWAVVAGGVAQLVLCLCVAWRIGYLPIFRHRLMGRELRAFGLLLLPGILGALCMQGNVIVSRAFASTLEEGSIVWLFFAERLFQFPLALIGISLGVALLPALSRALVAGDTTRSQTLRRQTQEIALLLSLPAAVGLALCAVPIVDVLFARGAFGDFDTRQTAVALQALALGLPAYVMVKILQPLFFADYDTRTPMLIAVAMVVVNIVLAMVLMRTLAHVGLALAMALSGWGQMFLLLVALRRTHRPGLSRGMIGFLGKVLAACVVMAGVVQGLIVLAARHWPQMSGFWLLIVLVIGGGASYLVAIRWFAGYNGSELFRE